MNGTTFWAYSLRRPPEGADLLDDLPLSESSLQCAGSAEAGDVFVACFLTDAVPAQCTLRALDLRH